MKELQRWKQGDKHSARHLNEAVDRLNEIGGIIGKSGVVVDSGGGYTSIDVTSQGGDGRFIIGKVYLHSTEDYEDCRYYILPQICNYASYNEKPTLSNDVAMYGEVNEDDSNVQEITAINIQEYKDNTHNVPDGVYVLCWEEYVGITDDETTLNGGTTRWFFSYGGSTANGSTIVVDLDEWAESGGWSGTVVYETEEFAQNAPIGANQGYTLLEINDITDIEAGTKVVCTKVADKTYVFEYSHQYKNGDTFVSRSGSLSIGSEIGTDNILEFTAPSDPGKSTELNIKATGQENQTFVFTGGAWIIDYPRSHD